MMRIIYSFIIFFYLFSLNICAQHNYQEYRFVNIKDGISKAGVSTINQDHHGFIWLGTNGSGLYRFDGIDYDYYKHVLNDSTSISNNLVYCSFIDKTNKLWIGTEDGLNLYDRENDQFKRIPILKSHKKNKTNISIRSLTTDNDGNLFIGTVRRGLFKLKLKNLEIEKIPNYTANKIPLAVHALKTDKNGRVFAGTNQGLKEYDNKTNTLKTVLFNGKNGYISIKEPLQTLLIDNNNTLWAGSVSNGLFNIKMNTNSFYELNNFSFSNNRFLSMTQLPDGSIMCGTENDGLFHIKNNGIVLKNYLSNKSNQKSILSNSIWSLFVDKNERIWLGYYNKGVAIYDKLYDKFKNLESTPNNPNSLHIGSVTGIVQGHLGKIWISMDGGGIDVYDKSTNKITHINQFDNSTYSGINNDYFETLFIDSKQNIWAGSWNHGLFFLKKGTKKFINYSMASTGGQLKSNTIFSIAEDSDGIIWIGSFYKGLHSFDPNKNKFTYYDTEPFIKNSLNNADFRKVLVDSRDNLWLGTEIGLFKINKENPDNIIITSMTDKMSEEYKNYTSANYILSLFQGKDSNTLWIGTRGAGLCKYNYTTDTFTWYNKFNNLAEENVSGIINDLDGNIWVSGNSGISKLNIKDNTFTNFTNNDGLLSNDFNINAAFRDDKGILYFGNFQGVDYFKPSDIKTNTSLTSLYLKEFKIFNKKTHPSQKDSPLKKVISETDSISLTSKQSVFTIEYSGINYTRPEKNEYAYYLEGYEKDYNYVGDLRSATYTNLDPGNYTFKLKASNNDGIWNEEPLSLQITILPPWWKTNWAIITYIFLFLLGLLILNKMTQNRIKEKELINNERNKRLQEKALNEKKFQFFTNISHEFRTPLTLIKNPLEDIIRDTSLNLPNRIKQKHNIIHKNTDRLYRLINELLDFRKLELDKVRIKAGKLNLVSLTKDVVSHFKEEAFSRNIHLSIDTDVTELFVWGDESMLEKIIFNLLSNAIKLTPDGGIIGVDLISKEELIKLPLVDTENKTKVIELAISDTGPGLKEDQVKRIFERFYQVDNLNKTYYGGTGIGLEVVQNFVQLHKGKVEVKSKLGKGTTFRILLPIGKSHFNENELASNSFGVSNKKEPFIRTNVNTGSENNTPISESDMNEDYTLLIVEDNVELRNYLKEEFKNTYKVLTANNGKEGIEAAKKILPDIIITDVVMSEMDGFNFCKKIKNDLRTSHIPLLMLTAKTQIDDRMEGIEHGADAYMVKPFDIRLLKLRLSQLITSRQLIFNKYFSLISDVENIKTTSLDKEFINKVLNYIDKNIGNPDLSVESMASEMNLSRSQFYRKIKALTNQTANEFLRNIRLQKAKQIIEKGNTNISDVCYKIGFSSPSYFTKCFKSYFGHLPTEVK
ncbi:two-component regulator propeller domain-containing protein [Thalassobellus citreus]|uniref:two-component regulator propeller domain-containing protein n=1 Tax=Thalassobellus citreus TaxID=3367752 RepID=UPI00379D39A9